MALAGIRTARAADAEIIAKIQWDTWRTAYADLLGERVLAQFDLAQAERTWLDTILGDRAKVYLATEGTWAVGFCAAGRAPEDEVAEADGTLPADAATVGLISALLVEPRWGRRGHGGRLLAAAAEDLRAGGASRGICWVPEHDEVSTNFYARVGWAHDGTVRTLDAAGTPLREIRLTGGLDVKLL